MKRALPALRGLAIALLLAPIRLWSRLISPALPPRCRYYPSCSRYAEEAIREHGPVRGVRLAAWRVVRCNPFSGGGFDPVPPRKRNPRPGLFAALATVAVLSLTLGAAALAQVPAKDQGSGTEAAGQAEDQAPTNDLFADPKDLADEIPVTAPEIDFAGTEPQRGAPDVGSDDLLLWYSWTAPESKTFVADPCESEQDVALGVFTGNSLESIEPVKTEPQGCGGKNKLIFSAEKATDYRIAVSGSADTPEPELAQFTIREPKSSGGILRPFVDAANAVILFFQENVGLTWGLAIIALTFTVRLAVVPLSLRGIRSMRQMQLVAPELKELQEKYKDDKERQQRELMKLYKDHGVNPLASCFPFLLQIPFFIAIYSLLRNETFTADVIDSGVDQGFLFINSVIEKPHGIETVILIALFISTTILSFLYTTSTTQTTSGAQKYIFLAFPVIFAPFIASSPAGLGLYWVATNIWSLGQQVVVQRLIPAPQPPDPDDPEAPKAAAVAPKKAPPPPPRKKKKRR